MQTAPVPAPAKAAPAAISNAKPLVKKMPAVKAKPTTTTPSAEKDASKATKSPAPTKAPIAPKKGLVLGKAKPATAPVAKPKAAAAAEAPNSAGPEIKRNKNAYMFFTDANRSRVKGNLFHHPLFFFFSAICLQDHVRSAPTISTPICSLYFLFLFAEENPDASIGAIAKIMGEAWKSIDDEEKAIYTAQAAEDKARYESELAAGGMPKQRKTKGKADGGAGVKRPAAKRATKSAYEVRRNFILSTKRWPSLYLITFIISLC